MAQTRPIPLMEKGEGRSELGRVATEVVDGLERSTIGRLSVAAESGVCILTAGCMKKAWRVVSQI